MPVEGACDQVRMYMAGEALLVVEFGDRLSAPINDAVLAFDHFLQDHAIEGLLETAPLSHSLALRFDPLIIALDKFRSKIGDLASSTDWFSKQRHHQPKRWRLPVVYGGESGPDLEAIARQVSLPIKDLIKAHCSTVQRVFMIGFAPGFMYTGMLPKLFQIPRLRDIKPHVPAGSVSIAIGQSVISATPQPTGWHTIGRTPLVNFDPVREPPLLIGAGDEIEFYQIDQIAFDAWQQGAMESLN